MSNAPFDKQRHDMVESQLRRKGITDELVLEAMLTVPRHEFVPANLVQHAYEDRPLEIGYGQTISQPYTVAFMAQAMKLGGQENVLEVGTGCGYAAAVLSRLAASVHTLERVAELAAAASQRLRRLGYNNASVHVADGTLGWPEAAPYDAIAAAASSPDIPVPLLKQLAERGRLVMPVGEGRQQRLKRATREGASFRVEDLGRFVFVPLIGEHGWKEPPQADQD
jgi:protein-L-isoaspartate(D-aspartate) O-methyltransferase